MSALICAGCASAPQGAPREYLDEQTAATITVAAEPWIFSRPRGQTTIDQGDFLTMYAIDVNRMGDHRQYLAVLQALPQGEPAGQPPAPILQLQADDGLIALQPAQDAPRALGLAQPVAQSYSLASRWLYYPIDLDLLRRLTRSRALDAALLAEDVRTPYVQWRDGRAEAAALSAVVPTP